VKKEKPYNPLDRTNLGNSVADALLSRDLTPLGHIEHFEGAGIYAIYYTGKFSPYRKIAVQSTLNKNFPPIYVGKAVPAGARKGRHGLDGASGSVLFKRLREHAENIKYAENLDLNDFQCRFLVVDDFWIPLGESLLIARFSPVWNNLVDGFGNHDPGSGRYNQLRSRWDTLHPGRPWALKCRERGENVAQIEREIIAYLNTL
jgi:hypothetical protein